MVQGRIKTTSHPPTNRSTKWWSSSWRIIIAYPSTLWVPIVVVVVVATAGIVAALLSANAAEQQLMTSALAIASSTGDSLSKEVASLVAPLETTTAIVTLNPEWSYLQPNFPKLADLLFSDQQSKYIIMLAPMGVFRASFPPAILDIPAVRALGDMQLPSSPLSHSGIASIITKEDILIGPQESELISFGASLTRPVFIHNVSAEEFYSQHPFGLPAPPSNCPKECYDAETNTAYWGHVLIGLDMESLRNGSNPIMARLREEGYRYRLSRPPGSIQFVFNATSGETVSSTGQVTLFETASAPGPDAVAVTFSVTKAFGFWVLYIDKEEGWGKPWKWPLVAMVIVLSLLFGVLIFLLLLSRRNNQMLLQALLPKEMIRKLQEDGTMVGGLAAALRSDTPADVMFNVIGECLRGQPPNMHDMMMVRSAILYGADMYQPVGLRERMADQEGDLVASALLQQLGQQRGSHTQRSDIDDATTDASGNMEMGDTIKELGTRTLAAIVLRRRRTSTLVEAATNLPRLQSSTRDSAHSHKEAHHGQSYHSLPQDQYVCSAGSGLLHSPAASVASRLDALGCDSQPTSTSTAAAAAALTAGDAAQGPSVTMILHPLQGPSGRSTPSGVCAAAALPLDRGSSSELTAGKNMQLQLRSQAEQRDVVAMTLHSRRTALAALQKRMERTLALEVPKVTLMDEVELFLSTHTGLWHFDAFELDRVTQGHPLSTLAFYLMSETGLISQLNLHSKKLARYLCFIEDGYLDNPYHNKVHAADVLQTLHMIVTSGGLIQGEDHLNHLGCYLAAVVHDFEHVGLSNDYLRGTHDPLAMRYNDQAPMENHHLASALSALDLPQHSFLSRVCSSDRLHLRKTLIDMVLATDMKQHFSIVSQFRTCRFALTAEVAGDASQLVRGEHDAEEVLCLSMQMALKCADLGHTCEGLTVHRRWVEALTEEFFLQGDAERAAGMVVQPLFDREKKLGLPPSQVGFFDFVVLPMYSCWVQHFPSAHPMLDAANENLRFWKAGGKS